MRDCFANKKISIAKVCAQFKFSVPGYYKSLKSQMKTIINEQLVIGLVIERRRVLMIEGYPKLYKILKPRFIELGIKIGRDKFREVLKANGLLVYRKKKYAKTTDSNHPFRIHKNLIKDLKVTRPNEVFVSDITYIRVGKGFMYLSLITDLYSRKIVGYNLNKSLGVEGCLIALDQALKQRTDKDQSLIHHSDRGIQYCCKAYTGKLKKHKIWISMAGKGNCYDNAVAERVNGILKHEFNLFQNFPNQKAARLATKQAVELYNFERLHMSLDYKIPAVVHQAA